MKKKTNPSERSASGELLRAYRCRGRDPERQEMLTQERLAELLEQVAGLPGYSNVQIAQWEKGGSQGVVIRHDNRQLLVGLIHVLYVCGELATVDEADALLHTGDYRSLNETEVQQISSTWMSNEKVVSAHPYSENPTIPLTLSPCHPLTSTAPIPIVVL